MAQTGSMGANGCNFTSRSLCVRFSLSGPPDGKRIAFFDVAPGKPWRIYLISSDGGDA